MPVRSLAAVVALASLTTSALAHPGHGAEGFAAGIAHPLVGLDHLAALLLVGVWSAALGARGAWIVPAAFMAAIAGGFGLGALGVGLPGIEVVIGLSLIAFGTTVALAWRAPVAAAAVLATVFGLFHGQAHWIGAGTDAGFIAGVLAASLAILALGIGLGRGLAGLPASIGRAAGVIGALAGVAALATLG